MAADEITERFSDIQDELIADVTKAEAKCDVLTARVAELEQEARIWSHGVTLPTRDDCWRQFRNKREMKLRLQLPNGPNRTIHFCDNILVIRFVGIQPGLGNGSNHYIFDTPWSHYEDGTRQKQIWLRTHELHLLRQVHDFYRVLQFEGFSGEFGDELDMQVRYGSHGWKWALGEIEYE